MNNDILVTHRVFSLVTSSLMKIIGKSPHSWPKNVIHGNSCIILYAQRAPLQRLIIFHDFIDLSRLPFHGYCLNFPSWSFFLTLNIPLYLPFIWLRSYSDSLTLYSLLYITIYIPKSIDHILIPTPSIPTFTIPCLKISGTISLIYHLTGPCAVFQNPSRDFPPDCS